MPESEALGGPSKTARLLNALVLSARSTPERGWHCGHALAEHALRELQQPPDAASRFSADLFRRIAKLSASSDACEKLGAVYAILELVEVPLGEDVTRLSRFAGCLHSVLGHTCEPRLAEAAAAALGRLATVGGALLAEAVEREASNPMAARLQRAAHPPAGCTCAGVPGARAAAGAAALRRRAGAARAGTCGAHRLQRPRRRLPGRGLDRAARQPPGRARRGARRAARVPLRGGGSRDALPRAVRPPLPLSLPSPAAGGTTSSTRPAPPACARPAPRMRFRAGRPRPTRWRRSGPRRCTARCWCWASCCATPAPSCWRACAR